MNEHNFQTVAHIVTNGVVGCEPKITEISPVPVSQPNTPSGSKECPVSSFWRSLTWVVVD